ncbi:hypothetical protein QFZ91_007308 [Paraburkholderia sp. JPY419]
MSIPFRYALPLGLIAAAVLAACGSNDNSNPGTPAVASGIANAQHVLLVSIDGMHQQDLANCVAAKTCPNIAALAQTGVTYSSASTPGLSDSFPRPSCFANRRITENRRPFL